MIFCVEAERLYRDEGGLRGRRISTMPVQSSIRINAGGAAFTDSLNRPWDGDKDFTGGSDISTATDITSSLPGFVIPPSDQTLYKSQKAGSSLTFSAPITNGNYTLTLFFAEIEGKTAGQRKFDVKVENKTVLTDFDIAAVAGGINKGMTRRFPVTVSDGKLDIAFTGKVGNAAVAGVLIEIPSFSAVTGATVDNPLTLPGVL
jgi:beta-galactosidase